MASCPLLAFNLNVRGALVKGVDNSNLDTTKVHDLIEVEGRLERSPCPT